MRAAAVAALLLACAADPDPAPERPGPPDLADAQREDEHVLAAGLAIEEHHATVAMGADGAMVATWRTEGIDGDIYTRRYDPQFRPADPVVSEAGGAGWTDYPDVVTDRDRFLLVHARGHGLRVRASADGATFGNGASVFKREADFGYARFADLGRTDAADGGVHILATWLSTVEITDTQGFYQARWLDENLAIQFDNGRPITLAPSGPNSNPADVAGLPSERFATVYARDGRIQLQLLAAGDLDGEPIDVSGTTTGPQPSRPIVAAAPSGAMAVAWHLRDDATRDLSDATLRLLDADGAPTTELLPLGAEPSRSSRPVAEFLTDDLLLVGWSEYVDDALIDEDHFAQLWTTDGTPLGDPQRINTDTEGRQKRTAMSVAESSPGTFDIGFVWETVLPGRPVSVRATRWTLSL